MELQQAPAAGAQPAEQAHAREEARRLLALVAEEARRERQPLSTYRLQIHKGFPFEQARAVVPYLSRLGVTDLYSSPILTAAAGSNHGYDVQDHRHINPELGTDEQHHALCTAIREHGLGQVLDIVPNHMGVGAQNALWMDLLENGPSARASRFFDVEWRPVKEELQDKVLLPVLGDRFGAVLERGELKLLFENGAFQIGYWENRFPVNPRSYREVLSYRWDELVARIGKGSAALDELQSIIRALDHMPARSERDPARVDERRREKEVVKRRLLALCEASPEVRAHLEENVAIFNGKPGDPRSFDLLDKLLDAQAYRLAHWRVSSEEINYRRFFDVNSLAAIRVEDPAVFEVVHSLPLQLVARGDVTGLRIDHPDGLALPTRYLSLLQEHWVLQRARAAARREGLEARWDELEPLVREELGRELAEQGKASPLFAPLYVVAEKILGRGEELPSTWAVRGTTGYDFLNLVNGLFVQEQHADAIERIYQRFIGGRIDFEELVYQKKKLILHTALASEINQLARQLNRISESNRWTRDFTLYSLRSALQEFVACFPVYRTYVGEDGVVDARDRKLIERTLHEVKRRNPAENASIYDFIKDILLQKFAENVSEPERRAQLQFVLKLQQVIGPVMAKGLEDTAFYVYNRLVSLNEVGGEPQRFGTSVAEFHRDNERRAVHEPRALLATATHDTKRGEDTRARIDALSELPREWGRALASCARATDSLRREVDGRTAPDRNELMLFWQSLVGVWPLPAPGADPLALPPRDVLEGVRGRMKEYLAKAMKEAKVNTSWINQDPAWEEAVGAYCDAVFALPPRHRLWKAFLPFARRVAQIGMHNALSQLVLKIASPGVPDFYQGAELWDLSLVDPDNRRPVDFALRQRYLDELQKTRPSPRALVEHWEDGRIKLFVTHLALRARREHEAAFTGGYQGLQPVGAQAERLVALARMAKDDLVVAVVPRLVAPLLDTDLRRTSLPPAAFAGTRVPVPQCRPGDRLRDVFTGEVRTLVSSEEGAALDAGELFSTLPVALLVRE